MPVITPDRFVVEENPAQASAELDRALWISEAGGLTQFGGFIEELQPGSRSSIKHWHSAEDEMVFVLEGEITVIEGTEEKLLRPGDAATFCAGVPIGHFLENRSASVTRCLVVGTRAPIDKITYPDHDRVCHRDRSLPDDIWTNRAGEPARSPYSK
ncbi:cupin domain-containing protein [Gloeobacter violaceus]|uniref:Glr3306 protein n=1 Tax=Gloeobacter violaceus (strain ATCC 29082 / PCC 7421) TaxID=251221 RepID=Q7NG67_GLOVI|nr:cupin domain-containing protein [Gloeobacter violaceus]BAC91247.1 glr3306 [Gloeobacter violaceus PCC 7421]